MFNQIKPNLGGIKMKNLLILTFALSLFVNTSGMANGDTVLSERYSNKNYSTSESLKSNEIVTLTQFGQFKIPYSKSLILEPEYVISKDDYSLWRIKSDYLEDIPGCAAIGNNYHYFVFKKGKFLFTVNECNKNSVYSFFAE